MKKGIYSRTRSQKPVVKKKDPEVRISNFLKDKLGYPLTKDAKWKGFDTWMKEHFRSRRKQKTMEEEERPLSEFLKKGSRRREMWKGFDRWINQGFIALEDKPYQTAEDVWRKTKVTGSKRVAPIQVQDVGQLSMAEIKLRLRNHNYKPSQLDRLPIAKLEEMLVNTNPKKYKVSGKKRKNVDTFHQHMKALKQKVNQKQLDDFMKKQQPSPPKRKKLPPSSPIKLSSAPQLLRRLSGDSLPDIKPPQLLRRLSNDSLPGIKPPQLLARLSNDSQPSAPKMSPHLMRVYARNNALINRFRK